MARRIKRNKVFRLIAKLSVGAGYSNAELHEALRGAGIDSEQFIVACSPKDAPQEGEYAHGIAYRQATSAKAMRIAELLQARKPDGSPYSHTEIGRDDSVRCSREYVRQVAWFRLGETGRDRQREIAAMRPKPTKERAFPRGNAFIHLIRRWLNQIDHSYCCQCHRCPPLAEMTRGRHQARCKACSAANTRRQHQTPEGKAKMLAWQQANKERCKGYSRAYWHRRKNRLQNAEVS